jgi:hypothetical protein
MDPYTYVANNPETKIDPTGQHFIPETAAETGGVLLSAAELAFLINPLTIVGAIGFGLLAIAIWQIFYPPAPAVWHPAYDRPVGPVPGPVAQPKRRATIQTTTSDQVKAAARTNASDNCKNCPNGVDLDLVSSEQSGGHTISTHIDAKEINIKALITNPQSKRYHADYGRFTNDVTAQMAVYDAVASGIPIPVPAQAKLVYEDVNVGYIVGNVYTYRDGQVIKTPTTYVTVIISTKNCNVLTAYPTLPGSTNMVQ